MKKQQRKDITKNWLKSLTTNEKKQAQTSPIQWVEQNFKHYWIKKLKAYQNNENEESGLWAIYQIERTLDLPSFISECMDFYIKNIEHTDNGSLSLFFIKKTQLSHDFWIVFTSSDDDDAWLEMYDEQGKNIANARTYLELMDWVDQNTLRASAPKLELTAKLNAKKSTSIWYNNNPI